MHRTKYLIAGSSHAGLSALEAIRTQDQEGSITLLTREKYLPYSPTILPYVVSGLVTAQDAFLWDEEVLKRYGVNFMRGAEVVSVEPENRTVKLQTGERLTYEKLLIATGARPALPPLSGLQDAAYHVLRSLDDAVALHGAAQKAKSALVLGGGLIGMHAAENLAQRGRQVRVVEAMPHVLPGYFDEKAAGLVHRVFSEHGVQISAESRVTHVRVANGGCVATLESGEELCADLLLVATGVKPRTECLGESRVERDEGILVDDRMRSSAENVWAAGDVAQARSFFGETKRVNATLPNAVEQGRIAGMDMVGDPALCPFPGALSMNTYRFMGNVAFSVGLAEITGSHEDYDVEEMYDPDRPFYQKLVFKGNRLVGASGINASMDPGVMLQIIGRKVELEEVREQLAASPGDTGRILMSRLWR